MRALAKQLVAFFIFVNVCGLISIQTRAQASAQGATTAESRAVISVNITKPLRQNLPLRISANGAIGIWQESTLGSDVAGLRITELRAEVGDKVERGQVLATFSTESLRIELIQAMANLTEVEVSLKEANNHAELAQSSSRILSKANQQLNQALADQQRAQARVEVARAQVQLQELKLKHAELISPDSGIISARLVSVGSVVGVGTELFRLIRQGRIEWRAELTGNEISQIYKGMPVQVLAPNGHTVLGNVRAIAPVIDPQTRNALVYVDIPTIGSKDSADLKPGMFVRGFFDLKSMSVLTLPKQAISMRDGFGYVYKFMSDGRVTQLKIKIGRTIGDRIEIISGLTSNDSVVSSGVGFLNDGDRVRVLNSP